MFAPFYPTSLIPSAWIFLQKMLQFSRILKLIFKDSALVSGYDLSVKIDANFTSVKL